MSNESIQQYMKRVANEIRNKAIEKSQKSAQQEVRIHSTKNPPTLFDVGDEVLVQAENKKANKVKGKGVSVGICVSGVVLESKVDLNKYKVRMNV